jgi:RHS repeat-associated protein
VLRVYSGASRAELAWEEDYVYRDGQPLAWVKADPEGEKKLFLHADHLGSTRQVTSTTGLQVARHDFLPFGEESTTSTNGDIKLKFTGHERDQPGRPMDYMHARSASPMLGRFLRVDPSGASAKAGLPQTWNRYIYAGNNPVAYQDPDGRECRMGILLEQDIQARFKGEISDAEYWDRISARAAGAEIGFGLGSLGRSAFRWWIARRAAKDMIHGPFGPIPREVLKGALRGGGPTTKLVTSLDSAPVAAEHCLPPLATMRWIWLELPGRTVRSSRPMYQRNS